MSGHNKWSSIKHKKTSIDAKKGRTFAKIIREIIIATEEGGSQIENNVRLRKAIEYAKEVNMPQDNIKKAIQRGNGEIPDVVYEKIIYEGYGPVGVALIIEAATDNKNRTVSDLRKIFSDHNGNLGETGCVGWMFNRKGYIVIDKFILDEEIIMNIALESGAEDFRNNIDKNVYELITSCTDLETVKNAFEKKNITIISSNITMLPRIYIPIYGDDAKCILRFMNVLEAHDDVKNIYANFKISNEYIENK
jgi:YebC/PmpR family DNA-binding regulatory protein